MFIKLTEVETDETIYVNAERAERIGGCEDHGFIDVEGWRYDVQETPDEILAIIRTEKDLETVRDEKERILYREKLK